MNELNPTNAFGELLLDLIDAQFDGDIDSGISALMQATGLAEEEVTAIINGQTIVDDESLLSEIVSAFPDADADDLEVIVSVADSVDQEDRDALNAQLESQEGDEQSAPEGDEAEEGVPAGAQYNAQNGQVNFNKQYMDRLTQLENHVAQFQYESAITDRLKQLNTVAERAVQAEVLPPSYKTMLIGNFADDSQRLARFGKIAADNGVPLETMLFATEFALGFLTDAAEFVEFKDYSLNDNDVAMANFSASLDSQVAEDIKAIFSN